MIHEEFQQRVAELGEAAGVANLQPNDDGVCAIELYDGTTVELSCDSEALILSADLGPLPDETAADWYPQLLEANFLWVGTRGATLGLYPPTKQVALAYREPMQCVTLERFAELLENFRQTVTYWRDRLQQSPESKTETTDMMRMMGNRV